MNTKPNESEIIEKLKSATSSIVDKMLHGKVIDEAIELIESLQSELATEKAKYAKLQQDNSGCTHMRDRLLSDRAELMQLRNFLRKYNYPSLAAWVSAYNQQNNALAESQRKERAAVEFICEQNSCPYDYYTKYFYAKSGDPNLPGWYFAICNTDRSNCKKSYEIKYACWKRLLDECLGPQEAGKGETK
ncbi:MAG: hypothetical protein VB078_00315 [Clostridiaceae bacterium]|nr:hypothetical protein [Clostridiaceae bacterium]